MRKPVALLVALLLCGSAFAGTPVGRWSNVPHLPTIVLTVNADSTWLLTTDTNYSVCCGTHWYSEVWDTTAYTKILDSKCYSPPLYFKGKFFSKMWWEDSLGVQNEVLGYNLGFLDSIFTLSGDKRRVQCLAQFVYYDSLKPRDWMAGLPEIGVGVDTSYVEMMWGHIHVGIVGDCVSPCRNSCYGDRRIPLRLTRDNRRRIICGAPPLAPPSTAMESAAGT
jgi:hypothetical protein